MEIDIVKGMRVEAAKAGTTPTHICRAIGMNPQKLTRWKDKPPEPVTEYVNFMAECKKLQEGKQ